MADEKNIIKINPSKSSTLEFEVTVSGVDNILPKVRFVIKKVQDGVDWCVECKKLDNNKWEAKFPSFSTKSSSTQFNIEVIVDEYFFIPAEGTINFITAPDVSFAKQPAKPTVSTSFVVKQDNDPIPKKTKIKEASGGGEVTGQYAPTNSLLVPEEDPSYTYSRAKTAQAEVYDQYIDRDKVFRDDIENDDRDFFGDMTPGQGYQYPQPDNKKEFDARDIAGNIIKQTIGNNIKTNSKPGSLFKRDHNGNIHIPGLENVQQKQSMLDKESKIRAILNK